MRHILTLRLIAIALAAPLLSGCAGLLSSVSPLSVGSQNLTGNWIFGVSDPPNGAPPLNAFFGALNGQGANITGTFHAVGCVALTQDINFTGSQAADGTLTLTSSNLPNNVATITVNLITLNNLTSGFGSLSITGSGPCAIPSITLIASEIQSVSGVYTGILSAAAGTPSTTTATASLTQATANSDGQFPVSGTVTIAGATCTNTFSLTGLVAGPSLSATLLSTSGPPATAVVLGPIVPGLNQPSLTLSINILSTGCNTGSFNATLNSQ
jgi:hypothetical protein